MTATKTILKEETLGVLKLMEDVLRSGGPLAEEYPLLFHLGGAGRFAALSDGADVRSACGFIARNFVFPGGSLDVGLVGSVVTDEAHRGQGLASQVLEGAEQELRDQGCAISMLWAADPDFYAKRGYRAIGWERNYVISTDARQSLPRADGQRPATGADSEAIHALYLEHTARVERTLEESSALLECPGMTVLVLERAGSVSAYACLGRGADFAQTVHEWGGPVHDVLALFGALLDSQAEGGDEGDLFVIAPPTAHELGERLGALGFGPIEGVLGMAKVLNPRALTGLLESRIRPEGSVVLREVEGDPQAAQAYLVGAEREVLLENEDLLVLLFAPRGDRTDLDFVAKNFGIDLSQLPLTPFCWGLDSI